MEADFSLPTEGGQGKKTAPPASHFPEVEGKWIQRVLEGETEVFIHLVRRYEVMVKTAVAQRLGMDPVTVDEASQEVFVKAFTRLAQFKGRSKFSTWLYAITVNHCRDAWRRHQAHPQVSWEALPEAEREGAMSQAGHGAVPTDTGEVERRRVILDRAWARLEAPHREILTLREIEGLSYEEIAEILDLAPGTVDSRLFRARQALQKLVNL